MPNAFPESDLAFSPDEKYVVCGTSTKEKGGRGELVCYYNNTMNPDWLNNPHSPHTCGQVFLNRADLSVATRLDICEKGVVRVAWHADINQIVATTADNSSRVLYSPELSVRGALLCAHRTARVKGTGIEYNIIKNPNSLKLFKEEPQQKKMKERTDKIKAKIPQKPLDGEGMGGRAAEHGHTITQHWIRKLIHKQPNVRDVDPREALLAMDAEAKKDPMWFGPAYSQTQPQPIFHVPTEEDIKEDQRVAKVSDERRQGNTAYAKLANLNAAKPGKA